MGRHLRARYGRRGRRVRNLWHLAQLAFVGFVLATMWGWLVEMAFNREPDEVDDAEDDFWDRVEVGDEWI